MFEAKLSNGGTLKKIVEAIKDVVSDVNLDVTNAGKCHHQHPNQFVGISL
jgi:aspartate carbamoyltransferase catalytic subunit